MAANVRQSPVAGRINAPAAPIVNIHDSRGSMQSYLIVAMLTMQFMFLGLIAWQMFAMSKEQATRQTETQAVATSEDESKAAGRDELLAEIIAGIDPSTGGKLIAKLEESQAATAKAASDLEAQRVASDVFARQSETLQTKLDKQESTIKKLDEKSKVRNEKLTLLSEEKGELEEQLKTLIEDGVRLPIWKDWKMWTAGILLSVFSAIIGFGAALGLRKPEDDDIDDRLERPDDSFGGKTDSTGQGSGVKDKDNHVSDESSKSEEGDQGRVSGINFEDDRR